MSVSPGRSHPRCLPQLVCPHGCVITRAAIGCPGVCGSSVGGRLRGVRKERGPHTVRWTSPVARHMLLRRCLVTQYLRDYTAAFLAPENAANAPMARNRKVIGSAVSFQPLVSTSKCSVNSEVAETPRSSAPIIAMPMSWPR